MGRTGWPWTQETLPLPATRSDGTPWPRISIVTPSYNQGQYIEETIRSVLLQGYPDLEYMVMDGDSRDETRAVLENYARWMTYCGVERDRGQADAVNKGLRRASGRIFNWINSDDILLPGALGHIGAKFDPVQRAIIAGNVINYGVEAGEERILNRNVSPAGLVLGFPETSFHQPGLWLCPARLLDLGGLNEAYHYKLDWHILVRYLDRWPTIEDTGNDLVRFRLHNSSKTVSQQERFHTEQILVTRKLLEEPISEALRECCQRKLATVAWWNYLEQKRSEVTSGDAHPIRATLEVCGNILLDPRGRLNRFTAGALFAMYAKQP